MTSSKSDCIPIYAISGLSHILTASEACQILGQSTVRSIVKLFLRYISSLTIESYNTKQTMDNAKEIPFQKFGHVLDEKENEEETYWVNFLTSSLAYDFGNEEDQEENIIPDWCIDGWHRLMNLPPKSSYSSLSTQQLQNPQKLIHLIPQPILGLDKSAFIQSGVVFPSCVAPTVDKNGHLALIECIFYAMATPSPSLILSRIAKASNVVTRTGYTAEQVTEHLRNNYIRHMVDHTVESSQYSAIKNNKTLIVLPDLLIHFAVCQRYYDLFMDPSPNKIIFGIKPAADKDVSPLSSKRKRRITEDGEEAIIAMSELTFRVYDAFQKKKTIDRDVFHRFISDIYGENAYTKEHVKSVLDKMFQSKNPEDQTQYTYVRDLKEAQYIRAIAKTVRIVDHDDSTVSLLEHILLDWFVKLGESMRPRFITSMQNFFVVSSSSAGIGALLKSKHETMLNASGDADMKIIYSKFGLTDRNITSRSGSSQEDRNSLMDIFQVKRRFQSIVENGIKRKSSYSVEETNSNSTDECDSSDSSVDEEGHNLPIQDDGVDTSSSKNRQNDEMPKNAIDQANFVHILSQGETDDGHGGFLTPTLAQLLFHAGCARLVHFTEDSILKLQVDSYLGIERNTDEKQNKSIHFDERNYWELFDVIAFSCSAVRNGLVHNSIDADRLLLEYIYLMFLQLPDTTATAFNILKPKQIDHDKGLTWNQVGHMILLLLSQAAFRLRTDSPDGSDFEDFFKNSDVLEDVTVDSSAASILGIHPKVKNWDAETSREEVTSGNMVPLFAIVENVFLSIPDQDLGNLKDSVLSFDHFLLWSKKCSNALGLDASQIKIGPLLLDLRLVGSVIFGVKPSSPSMELALIDELQRRYRTKNPSSDSAKRGRMSTKWFIINSKWWSDWESHTSSNGSSVGPAKINNTELMLSHGSLAMKTGLRLRFDFELIPPLVWSALHAWYDGGPPISRSVVPFSKDKNSPKYEIELYPLYVTVLLLDSYGEARPFQQYVSVSKHLPLRVLLNELCCRLNVDPSNGRLRICTHTTEPKTFNYTILDLDLSLQDQLNSDRHIDSGNHKPKTTVDIVLELKTSEGVWPSECDEITNKEPKELKSEPSFTDKGDGIFALHNMGNTCFMNSSIQIISHTPILKDYFTSKAYLNDVNKTNPLGYQGKLAQVCAVLISSLWNASSRNKSLNRSNVSLHKSGSPIDAPVLTPQTFKNTIGKLNADFQGNEQHDAQELLTFLLGGLSEDLNRIVKKPYTEDPDSDGRPDEELADIWWSNHLKRELSIIVALFNGQYKSVLSCKSCKYESARFEPFCFLQLPLPNDQVTIHVVYFPLSKGSSAAKYALKTKYDAKLYDVLITLSNVLYEEVFMSEAFDIDKAKHKYNQEDWCVKQARNMTFARIDNAYISNIPSDTFDVERISNKETGEVPVLFVYEQDAPTEERTEGDTSIRDFDSNSQTTKFSFLACCQRKADLTNRGFLRLWYHRIFGTPFILRVADLEGFTGSDLYDYIAEKLERYVPEEALKFLRSCGRYKSNQFSKMKREKLRSGRRLRNQTKDDFENSFFGEIPRYGFRLRVTTRDGKKCELCPWYECCIGCFITDDDYPSIAMNGDTIAIDWHIAVDLATNLFDINNTNPRANMLTNVKRHKTCTSGSSTHSKDIISLDDCLEAFAKEELIPEAYCSKCKDFRIQTKSMNIWRLPPIMIIHLKRFQFTQHTKRKLRDFVHFPLEGLDVSSVLSKSKPQSGVLASEPSENKWHSDPLYDLFGVIHHQGALAGGHYVASLKSEFDGKWRLFNDAQIYDVNGKDIIDASAYILFYIRRDMKDKSLEDFWEMRPRDGGETIEEELEIMMKNKDKCVIS